MSPLPVDTAAATLQEFLSVHGEAVRALLPGHLHHLNPWQTKQYGNLTKYTLGEASPGVWAHLHRLGGPDVGPNGPHDHPTRIDSYGIAGDYWERSYHEHGRTELTLRAAGGNYTVWPHTVHEIVALPQGVAWTLVFTHQVERDWRHYPELVEPHHRYHSAGRPDMHFSG